MPKAQHEITFVLMICIVITFAVKYWCLQQHDYLCKNVYEYLRIYNIQTTMFTPHKKLHLTHSKIVCNQSVTFFFYEIVQHYNLVQVSFVGMCLSSAGNKITVRT
jgi:hypothetical protein